MPDTQPLRVLIVEPDPAGESLLQDHVRAFGHAARRVRTAEESLLWLHGENMDVVVFRLTRPGPDGLRQVEALRTLAAQAEVVLVAPQNAVPTAVEAVRRGAAGVVAEPYRLDTLELAIRNAGGIHRRRRVNAGLRALHRRAAGPAEMVGATPAIQRLREAVMRVAPTRTPVLIAGEAGAGRTLLARVLHDASARAAQPCLVLDCTAADPLAGLLHLAGAASEPDLLPAVEGGTVVLQHVQKLEPKLQAALARLLESSEERTPDRSEPRPRELRVVATGPPNLRDAVDHGTFREDLFYALSAIDLHVPPLRERLDDLPALVAHFLGHDRAEAAAPGVDPAVLDVLARYPWPGNVWELRNVLERAAIRTPGPRLTVAALPPLEPAEDAAPPTTGEPELRLADVERRHIQRVLDRCGGNKSRAARVLGISAKTLYNKLHRYRLGPRDEGAAGPAVSSGS